jgi:glycosyltransferase 2 family protein
MNSSSRKWLVIGIVVAVVGYLVYRSSGSLGLSGFSGKEMWAALRGANPFLLGASLILIYACYGIRSLRWQVFQRNLGSANIWDIYTATLGGFAAVYLMGRAGEPVRPLLIAKRTKHSVADIFGIWVLERLYDFGAMAVIAATALIAFNGNEHAGVGAQTVIRTARLMGVGLALAVAAGVAFLVYLRVHGTAAVAAQLEGWLSSPGWKSTVAKMLLGLIAGIQTVRSAGDLAWSLLYSAVHWFLVLLVYYCVAQSFGGPLAELRLGDCMLLLALSLIGSVAQLPGVGGGSQALTIFAFTQVFGVEKNFATVAAFVLWLVTFASCSIAGVPLLIRDGVSLGQLRGLAEHEKEELAEIAAHAGAHSGGEKAE